MGRTGYRIGMLTVLFLAAAAGCGEILGLGQIELYEDGKGGSPSTGSGSTTVAQGGGGGTSTTSTGVIAQSPPGRNTIGVVSAAGITESASHRMVFAVGQSTPFQGNFSSESYHMRGGVVGATGSEK